MTIVFTYSLWKQFSMCLYISNAILFSMEQNIAEMMKGTTMFISLILLQMFTTGNGNKIPLYIGGFFPMQDGGWDGSGILPAAEMAIEDVNNDSSILPEYELRMIWNNSKCMPGETMQALFQQLHNEPTKIMLLGAGCSTCTSSIAETVPFWNLVQVSHASTSPDLDNRDLYPLLFRVYPSDSNTNIPRVTLLKQFGWKRAAVITSSSGSFTKITSNLLKEFTENNIEIITFEQFSSDSHTALLNIKRKDARVIFGFFFPNIATHVLCQAYKLGMTGSTFTWLLPGWYEDNWWKLNDTSCTYTEMKEAVSYHIVFNTVSLAEQNTNTDVFRNPGQFVEEYAIRTTGHNYGGKSYASSGYDSVWVIAHALNKSSTILSSAGIKLEDFDYTRNDIARVIFEAVNKTDFMGISGRIQFNYYGMRVGAVQIKQLQGTEYKLVCKYYPEGGLQQCDSHSFLWKTKNGRIPTDGPKLIKEWTHVNQTLFYVLTVLSSAGILFCAFLLLVNIFYRDRKLLKMSSPNINYLIIAGSFILYVAAILLGIHEDDPADFVVKDNTLANICIIRAWLLTLAFTTSFGSITAKAWRIYRIATNSKIKKTVIKDIQLFIIVGVLILIDLFILITWILIDPMTYKVTAFDKKPSGEDSFIQPYLLTCSSRSIYWFAGLYTYKGVLMLYGAMVAWETRKIKITLLNDAKSIAITIYTVTVLSGIAVPVSYVLEKEIDFTYGVTASFLIFGTTIMLAFSFLPKVQTVLSTTVADENVMISNMNASGAKTLDNESRVDITIALKRHIEQLENKIKKQEQEISDLKTNTDV